MAKKAGWKTARNVFWTLLPAFVSLNVVLGLLLPALSTRQSAVAVYRKGLEDGSIRTVKNAPAGERVRLVETDEDALEYRLRAIEAAQESIRMATFDFEDDSAGRLVMAYLFAAAERGVQVDILLDGFNGFFNTFGEEYFKALVSHPNISMKKYNRGSPFFYRINYRMHDKYLIIDDMLYLLGGRNTSAEFLGDYDDKKHSFDRDILVYEPMSLRENGDTSLSRLKEYQEYVWNLRVCKPYTYDRMSKKVTAAKDGLREIYRYYSGELEYGRTAWKAITSKADSVRLLSGDASAKVKKPLVFAQLCHEMQKGHEVIMQSPYTICNTAMFRDLSVLTIPYDRNLFLLTNAPESGANPWGSMDFLSNRWLFLKSGIGLYELFSDQSMHTKTIIMDDDVSIIGSYNLDRRSTYLDTETMVVVKSKELNAQLRERMQDDMDHSVYFNSLGKKTVGPKCTPTKLGRVRQALYRLGRIVLPLFRQLL